ncbi:MAG: aminoacyl-histidine dipeptidase [Acidobacteria bacterium]|nr:aminoacyl-histidine dipeptidase [Acidobacteriota bacterium]
MESAVKNLKPELVWQYFARISRIPRCSKNEAAMTRFVLDTANKLGLEARADKLGNVVVRKPASPGRDKIRPVALQGHLDMVCEKNSGKRHDFRKDPIRLVRKGGVLKADGTTLGADNGIAVAANLAVMQDRSLKHGPLELLFTVDEETGMTGAAGLKPDFLESRTLLNLDSEEEGTLYVGCAGGRDTSGSWKLSFEKPPAGYLHARVKVSNLKGGHSGLEIDKGRGNAIKIAGRVLRALEAAGARLEGIEGGNKRNAIARECEASLFLPAGRIRKAEEITADLYADVKKELGEAEQDFKMDLVVDFGDRERGKVLKKALQRKILGVIAALPHGVIGMSGSIEGLVETSTNVAVVRTGEDSLSLDTSQRSSVASRLNEVVDAVSAIFSLGGASIRHSDGYPGWEPDMESPILKTARSAYRSLYGKPVRVKAIHAGLECGLVGRRVPGMDMLSFGPTIEGAHSPDERIHIDSVGKFWKFLLEILGRIR